jgi:glycosyltransferase involved in cell wall biosynthesis
MVNKAEIVVAMPVFNEAEGITEFLEEIASNFYPIKIAFVVVDDASTDSTQSQLENFMQNGNTQMRVIKNSNNLGHGPSTIKAIDNAISLGSPYVMTVDGDGQFKGSEMRQMFDFQVKNNYQVVEGLRTNRNEPVFRKITSMCTRLLVFMRSHKLPQDANTPLRVYETDRLLQIRKELGSDFLTPNLHISQCIRSELFDYQYGTFNVQSLSRRGSVKTGTMWRSKRQRLPSKRFLQFMIKATRQWIATSKFLGLHSQN